jgi:hypothetical protein
MWMLLDRTKTGKLKASEELLLKLNEWNTPENVLDLFRSVRQEIELAYPNDKMPHRHFHQHASFQGVKEAWIGAMVSRNIEATEMRLLRKLPHPDLEIKHKSAEVEQIEITTAEKIGRNPSADSLTDERGFVFHPIPQPMQ